MSMVLGPIHHWLYGKIGYQEELTTSLARHAREAGWIENTERFEKTLPPLETVIDVGNIHGWLQEQIHDAETRYAALVCELLEKDRNRLEELCAVAGTYGAQHAVSPEATPEEAYRAFEDFFVNGMPCDRINNVTSKDADSLSWEMTRDIHAPYWMDSQEGSSPYYVLRKSAMDGMLCRTELCGMTDTAHYTITRKHE